MARLGEVLPSPGRPRRSVRRQCKYADRRPFFTSAFSKSYGPEQAEGARARCRDAGF